MKGTDCIRFLVFQAFEEDFTPDADDERIRPDPDEVADNGTDSMPWWHVDKF